MFGLVIIGVSFARKLGITALSLDYGFPPTGE